MSGASIASKVKAGLRKANLATGENPNKIYKQIKTLTGGDGINPPNESIELKQLVDAIFQSYDLKSIDGTNVKASDRRLVCNGDVPLDYGDIVVDGSARYAVINVDSKSPAGIPLAYIAQLRRQ